MYRIRIITALVSHIHSLGSSIVIKDEVCGVKWRGDMNKFITTGNLLNEFGSKN